MHKYLHYYILTLGTNKYIIILVRDTYELPWQAEKGENMDVMNEKERKDAAKISAEEEQRKNRLKEIQEATKNDIVNYVKRVRNGSEMTEEERKKEAEREEWKKKNNKEFGV